jgi:hypothetical protein
MSPQKVTIATLFVLTALFVRPCEAVTAEPIRVTVISEDLWQMPGAPAGSTTIRYSLVFGREVWRNAKVMKDEWIEDDIRAVSRTSKVLYINLGVTNPNQTAFSQVLAGVDRLKRLAAKSANRACKTEIVVGIRGPIKFEPPITNSSAAKCERPTFSSLPSVR